MEDDDVDRLPVDRVEERHGPAADWKPLNHVVAVSAGDPRGRPELWEGRRWVGMK